MECVEETKKMVEFAKKRQMPDKESQDKLMACWAKTYTNSMNTCKEDLEKLIGCLDNNERRSLKCADLRKMYEENYVKNVILKEQN
mmetsp:Transcript_4717/g.7845  ORF Transcript_4717/g.7845 Transcript_4717/m.7845 type:complete len:86 (+) Transcript_4717:217-474(+)